MHTLTIYNLQLKYYNLNMFRPSSGHLQGVHTNYIYKTQILCKHIMPKLGFDVSDANYI